MSVSVVDHSVASLLRNFRCRRPRLGPEATLIEAFLSDLRLHVPRGHHITIFREPRLECGFPDLVIVTWQIATVRRWVSERLALKPRDVRLLHYLSLRGLTSVDELSSAFGTAVLPSLGRLQAAKVVRPGYGGRWKAAPLSQIYAIRSIVAVEAKVLANATVLDQAELNTWFASESYVLLPRMPNNAHFLDLARQRGVGVWANPDGCGRQKAPETRDLPGSYASWLFNEWAWMAAVRTGAIA